MELSSLTVAEARRALDAKEFSSTDLTREYLKNIEEKDGEIHSYLEVWSESALSEARRADAMIADGARSPLLGIPLAIKDNILMEGRKASAASKMLEGYVAPYDSTVSKKLKENGTVFLGRTNMDEFAMGSSTEHSAFGPTKNPLDLSRVPGGSSGGSAAATAADLALASLGSDTGGSIRQPAAYCGVVGLKTTYGAVSRHGLIALGSSLDQIGPFAKTVEDVKILFTVIRGYDENDSTSLPEAQGVQKKPKVIGIPRSFLSSGIDADALEEFEHSLTLLKSQGYEVRDVELPNLPLSLAAYYIIMSAEASTNLSRFDGIRYGHSVQAENIVDVYNQSRSTGFGEEVRRRILLGTFVLSSGYVDAYYRKATAARETIRKDFLKAFETVDVIATPTTPSPAFTLGEKADPLAMYAADICTVPVNLAGVPAISVPKGQVERAGKILPVGFQIIAPHWGEEALFSVAQDLERA